MALKQGIAIVGGSFNPIHIGHIEAANDLGAALRVQTVKLIPVYQQPNKLSAGLVSAKHRVAMIKLGIVHHELLALDECEVKREGPSYSIDTLSSLRQELGWDMPITMVLGADAFAGLHAWKDWTLLTDYGHIVILDRPGYEDLVLDSKLRRWAEPKYTNTVNSLSEVTSGLILKLRLPQFEISSTQIRALMGKNKSVAHMLPSKIIDYIVQHKLYKAGCI